MLFIIVISVSLCSGVFSRQNNSPHDASKLSSQTEEAPWRATWGSNLYDVCQDVAVDGDAIYCIGSTTNISGNHQDIALVKFWSYGGIDWNITWGGPSEDSGWAIAVDESGAIYCAGTTSSFGAGQTDFVLIKFNIDGTQAWNCTWGGAGAEERPDIVVDANGSIICTGTTASFEVVTEQFLLKYFPNGTLEWSTTWGDSWDIISRSVAIDNVGNIYCTGLTINGSTIKNNQEILLTKHDSNGLFAWSQKWGTYDSEYGFAIEVDSEGFIYGLGFTSSPALTGSVHRRDYIALVKFFPNGTYLWNYTWGNDRGDSNGLDLTIDSNGTVYCVGYNRDALSADTDLVLLKILPNKTLVGSTTWGCNNEDIGTGIALGGNQTIYCAGWTTSFGQGSADFVLIKFKGLMGPEESCPDENPKIPGFDLLYLIFGIGFILLQSINRKKIDEVI